MRDILMTSKVLSHHLIGLYAKRLLPTYVSDVESYSETVDKAGRKSRIFLQHPYEIVQIYLREWK